MRIHLKVPQGPDSEVAPPQDVILFSQTVYSSYGSSQEGDTKRIKWKTLLARGVNAAHPNILWYITKAKHRTRVVGRVPGLVGIQRRNLGKWLLKRSVDLMHCLETSLIGSLKKQHTAQHWLRSGLAGGAILPPQCCLWSCSANADACSSVSAA